MTNGCFLESGLNHYWIDAKRIGQQYQWTWSGRQIEERVLKQLNISYLNKDGDYLFLHQRHIDNITIVYELYSADEEREQGFICEAKSKAIENKGQPNWRINSL